MYFVRRSVLLVPISLAALTVACGGSASLSPTGPTASTVSSIWLDDTGGSETASTLARNDNSNNGKGGGSQEDKPGNGKPEAGDDGKPEKPFQGSLSGFVTAVNGTSITVRGITVTPAADAVIRHGNLILEFSSIVVGNHVQAKGTMTEGALLASEIKVEQTNGEDDDTDDTDELNGAISGLTATTGCPAVTFVIGTTTVKTSTATDFEGVACTALVNGAVVEVEGALQTDGSILATKVEVEDDEDDD